MKDTFIIYDSAVKDFALELSKSRGIQDLYELQVSEGIKNLETVQKICFWLLERRASRKALLIAIGGGITSDITGFVASIYKRGVSYEVVPTTLLSMVDASIGGKTGVNLDSIKNAVGSFYPAKKRYIFPEVLYTLSQREIQSGVAEMLKTFIIADRRAYRKAVKLLSEDPSYSGVLQKREFHALIRRAAAIKQSIVRRDPLEKGLRKQLNLGHTFAHGIEWYQKGEGLSHGQAVAVGMVQAAKISAKMGICSWEFSRSLERDLEGCGLPVQMPCSGAQLMGALLNDKKNSGGATVCLVLPKTRIGVTVKEISEDDLYLYTE